MSGERRTSWQHQLAGKAFALKIWAAGLPGVMLAMAMGSGKTKLAIDLIEALGIRLVLIVCPMRVVEVWRYQLQQHAGFPYTFHALDERAGSVADKARLAAQAVAQARINQRVCILAINYESVRLEPFASWALNTAWPLIIADEVHRLKAPAGKISRYMGRLAQRARRRLGLSGTPLPHSLLDAWAQYRFLDPSVYDATYWSFKTRYGVFGGFQNRVVKGFREEADFNRRFYQIAFRVTKAEALPDLPPEMDQALHADLSRQGRRIYDQLENEFIAWLGEAPEEEITVANALVLYLRLQQLTGGTLKDDTGAFHNVDTAKEELLADWLEDLPRDEPTVIFARFLPDLAAIERACKRTGHTCAVVSGQSKHGIEIWKSGQANVLAAQISVASEGQDLTRARYAVYYSVGSKLSDYVQSRARIHRAGQTRPVTYYHLLIRDTIDDVILRALENRWDLVESVLKELKSHATRPVSR
jgi:SNF2 family DNA or RNA helicase